MPKKKYLLVPTKTFLKDLKKVDPKFKEKISKVLDSLQADPLQGKKLTAIEIGKWRVRMTWKAILSFYIPSVTEKTFIDDKTEVLI